MKKLIFAILFVVGFFSNLIVNVSYADETNGGGGSTAGGSAGGGAGSDSSGGGEEGGGDDCGEDGKNCIKLNTDFPGVGRTIKKDAAGDVFGQMMSGLMKLALNFVVAGSFLAFLAAGIMITLSGVNQSVAGKGKDLIKKVILGIVLLGLSGLILHTINPNFFT